MRKQFNTRQTADVMERVAQYADENNLTKSAVVALAVSRLGDCGCHDGILGRCAGHWVYCHCRAGIAVEMEHLDEKMSILAEDLATMPVAESNEEERRKKLECFVALTTEYQTLEGKFERLGEIE